VSLLVLREMLAYVDRLAASRGGLGQATDQVFERLCQRDLARHERRPAFEAQGPHRHPPALVHGAHDVNQREVDAPRLALNSPATAFRLGAYGNALGGIRTPCVDVPTAVLSGLGQTGEMFAILFGRTEPFDDVTLSVLYPEGKTQYLHRFEASLDNAIAEGFILGEDRTEILELAAASYPLVVARE
jgi:Alpha/beta hydrolase domain